jgi:hypothetical protein
MIRDIKYKSLKCKVNSEIDQLHYSFYKKLKGMDLLDHAYPYTSKAWSRPPDYWMYTLWED